MSKSRRRRCRICHELFRPDPRVQARQKTCGRPPCQQARRAQTQAEWRRCHPDYFVERRLRKRLEQEELAREALEGAGKSSPPCRPTARYPAAPRVAPAWRRLPWDLIQAELGVLTADVLAQMTWLVARKHRRSRAGPLRGATS
jgi:hypothetical protein